MVVLCFECFFCIFAIEKFEISKRIFSKVYFRIMLCMFVANYMVVALKTTELWILDLPVFILYIVSFEFGHIAVAGAGAVAFIRTMVL